jgi:hypothetical protein
MLGVLCYPRYAAPLLEPLRPRRGTDPPSQPSAHPCWRVMGEDWLKVMGMWLFVDRLRLRWFQVPGR